MFKRLLSDTLLVLLLTGISTLTLNIRNAKSTWTGTVYIRADGRIDPPDAPISSFDNITYTFTGNINGSIVVERSNIIVDGGRYLLHGSGAPMSIGIDLTERSNVTIKNIRISLFYYGIRLYDSSNNSITGNNIANNWCGICLYYSSNNIIFHNNFVDNAREVYSYISVNVWDDGYPSGGNYWSDYTGVDLFGGPYQNMTGGDGIGDTPYTTDANNQDRYPLMAPFSIFEAGVWDGTAYNVDILSNSTVSDFKFNVDQKSIIFNVTGDNGTLGFCRVTIPKDLLWVDDDQTILVDSQPITDYTKIEDANYTYLYFTYSHSTKTVVKPPSSQK